ncbi:MAG: CTP synthase [Candidatus Aenigmarchaeota archaeon]|nr:CTP synthase [Candidatus Aenigmarchaeota archaeon]
MRVIVVTGGVISGVGKGVATASIGRILKEYGFSVTAIKIDPYINYDAGTLRPTEHGEVWVTDDGGEIDQDLGNYERFLSVDIPKTNNITTGQIYKEIIDKERLGKFLGQTVQFIPHVPDEIKRRIKEAGKDYDFVLVEIGGTIGDYENLPFLFATKSLEIELGKNNLVHILVSYMPVPSHVGEMKTKPTQQAIRMLNETGIFPDFVLCRAVKPLDDVRKKKIETYANISSENIISAPDIKSIYRVPLNFEKERLGEKILKRFELKPRKKPDWNNWKKLVERIENPRKKITVAMVGKYVDIGDFSLADSYISINQALEHAGAELDIGVDIKWIDSKQLENKKPTALKKFDGIVIPGGFGSSGVEGKINAIKFARETNIPFLGLCFGLQLGVIEFARNVCNMKAHTTEVDPKTQYPVIDVLPSQKQILAENKYGGTMRLGAYAAILERSKTLDLYIKTKRLEKDIKRIEALKKDKDHLFRLGLLDNAKNIILERHRHRYEVNPKFIDILKKHGLFFPGYHIREDGTKLMEFIELPKHKFFIATQAHPEFKSRLGDPAPLVLGFVEACKK